MQSAIVDRFLANHHSNLVTGTVEVLRPVPVKIESESRRMKWRISAGAWRKPREGLVRPPEGDWDQVRSSNALIGPNHDKPG